MKLDPKKHHRSSIRLKGYDYSQAGTYFLTICVYNREFLFGEVVNREMALNVYGQIVWTEWYRSADIRHEIGLDAFVVMPNHIHGIVIIHGNQTNDNVGATGRSPLQNRPHGPTPKSLGAFVGGFKSATTKRINISRDTPGTPVWQRNYYEHIIRDETEMNRIREYIQTNPLQWHLDRENPHCQRQARE